MLLKKTLILPPADLVEMTLTKKVSEKITIPTIMLQCLDSLGKWFIHGGAVLALIFDEIHKVETAINDIDFLTTTPPQELDALMYSSEWPYRHYFIKLSTKLPLYGFKINNVIYEIASIYKEGLTKKQMLINSAIGSEPSSHGRDFTINTLFLDWHTNKILDYVDGIKDIKQLRLKTYWDPAVTLGYDTQKRTYQRSDKIFRFFDYTARFYSNKKMQWYLQQNLVLHISKYVALFSIGQEKKYLYKWLYKGFVRGYGVGMYKTLQDWGILTTIFSCLNKSEIEAMGCMLELIDQHYILNEKIISPATLYALLLLRKVCNECHILSENRDPSLSDNIEKASETVLNNMAEIIIVPESNKKSIISLWCIAYKQSKINTTEDLIKIILAMDDSLII